MATITKPVDFDYALAPFGYEQPADATAKGFWSRLADAVIASRMAAAERELKRHAGLIKAFEERVQRRDLPF